MFSAGLSIQGLRDLLSGKDPVCGMDVEAAKAAGTSTYQGKTYYFCAPACKQQFDASPDKYATKG